MGWRPVTDLSGMIRERLQLRIVCPCGHVALLDPFALRTQLWKRAASIALVDLPKHLLCSKCGGRRFKCHPTEQE